MSLTSNEIIDAVRKALTDKKESVVGCLKLPRFLDNGVYKIGMYCSVVSAQGIENWVFLDDKVNETVIDENNTEFTIEAIRLSDGFIDKVSMYDVLPGKIGFSLCNKEKKDMLKHFGEALTKVSEKNVVENYLQNMQMPIRKRKCR